MKLRISQIGKKTEHKIPPGDILRPLLFIIWGNHIPQNHGGGVKVSNSTQYSVSTGYNETQTEESVNTEFLTLKHW